MRRWYGAALPGHDFSVLLAGRWALPRHRIRSCSPDRCNGAERGPRDDAEDVEVLPPAAASWALVAAMHYRLHYTPPADGAHPLRGTAACHRLHDRARL